MVHEISDMEYFTSIKKFALPVLSVNISHLHGSQNNNWVSLIPVAHETFWPFNLHYEDRPLPEPFPQTSHFKSIHFNARIPLT